MAGSNRGEPSTGQLLSMSWFDSAGIPTLNQYNVLDYFSQLTNPFYDRTCNNEVIKMQRADPAQLKNMTGVEYCLLHVQEPILYVIRKIHRQSPESVIPLADYYILGGVVYQCPDLWSIINSRLLSTISRVNEAFNETISYARCDPTKGYHWEFPNDKSPKVHKKQPSQKEEPSDVQRRKVDSLLMDLVRKFPPKAFARKDGNKPLVVGLEKQEKAGKSSEVSRDQGPAVGVASVGGIKRPGHFGSDKQPDPKRKRT